MKMDIEENMEKLSLTDVSRNRLRDELRAFMISQKDEIMMSEVSFLFFVEICIKIYVDKIFLWFFLILLHVVMPSDALISQLILWFSKPQIGDVAINYVFSIVSF